jgi:glycosyltransferase involved in cell wall biosynthesis
MTLAGESAIAQTSPRVVAISNLFSYHWDPTRGVFNQQQFDGLAKRLSLTVLVAVSWTDALRKLPAFARAFRAPSGRDYPVHYFVSLHLPGIGRSLSAALYCLSLLGQRLITIIRARPNCLIGSFCYPDGVATSALGKMLRIPVVLKVHGTDVNVYTSTALRRWQIRVACNWANRVVCVSKALADRLIEIGVQPQRVTVIYNGVDQGKLVRHDRATARVALNIERSASLLLFVGNLQYSKGAGDLLEAFAQLRVRRPQALLIYVGDGANRAELESRVVQLQLTGAVRFMGKLPHSKLGQWYAASDLSCLPSHAEGVPNVILESMACGRAVVATRVGGIPEVLPDFAGQLVAAHDTAALANALDQSLARDWDSQRIAAHAAGFTWERNIAMMLDIIKTASIRGAATT